MSSCVCAYARAWVREFKIVFHGAGNRSYILGAYSQESMEQWMKALAFASYDYMKLMVSDLQRQLDEMEGIKIAYFNFKNECKFYIIYNSSFK